MKLSIVTTMYRSAPYLAEFHRRAVAAAAAVCYDFEVVLVDDGSPDESRDIALAVSAADPRVRLIELSRNFGHHKAIMTGLKRARGELVFLIDCDLEEEPELLPQFHREMQATKADVVYGVQAQRKGSAFERVTGGWFYQVFNLISSSAVPQNLLTARLMTREYVHNLIRHREREVFLAGLFTITGFAQVGVTCHKHSRRGSSSYSLPRKVALLVNAVTSFSNAPLLLIFHIGWVILALASLAGVSLLLRWLLGGELSLGWPSLIVSMWFLGGLGIFCQGILAIYMSKVFSEVKRRPYTIVRSRVRAAGGPQAVPGGPARGGPAPRMNGPSPRPPGPGVPGPGARTPWRGRRSRGNPVHSRSHGDGPIHHEASRDLRHGGAGAACPCLPHHRQPAPSRRLHRGL